MFKSLIFVCAILSSCTLPQILSDLVIAEKVIEAVEQPAVSP